MPSSGGHGNRRRRHHKPGADDRNSGTDRGKARKESRAEEDASTDTPLVIRLVAARYYIVTDFQNLRAELVHLRNENIVPMRRHEAIEGIKAAIDDLAKRLKAKEEAYKKLKKALEDQKKEQKKQDSKSSRKGSRIGKGVADEDSLQGLLPTKQGRSSGRQVELAEQDCQKRNAEYDTAYAELTQKLSEGMDLVAQGYGTTDGGALSGYEAMTKDKFARFCHNVKLTVEKKRDDLSNIKDVQGLVTQAYEALGKLREILYDQTAKEVDKVDRDLQEYAATHLSETLIDNILITIDQYRQMRERLDRSQQETKKIEARAKERREREATRARQKWDSVVRDMERLRGKVTGEVSSSSLYQAMSGVRL